ncbi:MAG TPA: flagellar hook-length control protein FliK [Bryobacteraceae bacterium]|nr:flagellar hook-length control protein FliK [Bryobacteraceae bacterium]
MKVQPNPEPAQPSSKRPAQDAQDKRFSSVLDKQKSQSSAGDKRAAGEKRSGERKGERGVRDEDEAERPPAEGEEAAMAFDVSAGAAAAAMAARAHTAETLTVRHASGAAPAEPALLTGLVTEISAVVEPRNTSTVDIQFDSKTLAGLHVRVVKAGEHISVRFNTNSESVAALLTRNTESLAAALQARGFQVGAVTVVSEPKPPSSESDPRRGSSGSRQDRGGRERRRQ